MSFSWSPDSNSRVKSVFDRKLDKWNTKMDHLAQKGCWKKMKPVHLETNNDKQTRSMQRIKSIVSVVNDDKII